VKMVEREVAQLG